MGKYPPPLPFAFQKQLNTVISQNATLESSEAFS